MISIESLGLDVDNQPLFSNMNLDVKPGEKWMITGPSGTGKTSLFKLILGFEQPKTGKISVNGLPVDKNCIRSIRQHIFYLSQDVDMMEGTCLSVLSDILDFNRAKGIFPKDKQGPLPGMVQPHLEFLELAPSFLSKQISSLSGGERQRFGLMIGFMLNRPVWLLDEPTSALDDALKEKIALRILSMDLTLLVISHDRVWGDQPGIQIKRWN